MRNKAKIAILGLGLVGVTYYGLFNVSYVPQNSSYKIDLPALRRSAQNSGKLPLRLNAVTIAKGDAPQKGVVAGDSFLRRLPIDIVSFQVVYGDGKTGIIDTAQPQDLQDKLGGVVDPAAYDALQQAMGRAEWIALTHEHPDHLGGLARAPALAALAPKARLTREQLGGKFPKEVGMTEDQIQLFRPLNYEGLHVLAPGVLVQAAPGHSPGSQLVFVMLANGEEFLLVGDIAWNQRNIDIPRGRPFFVSLFFLGEDRSAVAEQLRALHNIRDRTRLVVVHDRDQITTYTDKGLMGTSFE